MSIIAVRLLFPSIFPVLLNGQKRREWVYAAYYIKESRLFTNFSKATKVRRECRSLWLFCSDEFPFFFYWPGVPAERIGKEQWIQGTCFCIIEKGNCLLGQPWNAPVCLRSDGCSSARLCSDSWCFEEHKTALDSTLAPAGPNRKRKNVNGFRNELQEYTWIKVRKKETGNYTKR